MSSDLPMMPARPTSPRSLLLVEDDEGLGELCRDCLQATNLPLDWVRTGEQALSSIADQPDCLLLLDYSLPDLTATSLIQRLSQAGPVPPFIVVTGRGDEHVAVSLMKLGARDYLVKDPGLLDRLLPAVERVLREVRTERQLADLERVRLQEEKELAAIYDHVPQVMLLLDGELRLRKANAAAVRLLGKPLEQILGLRLGEAFDRPLLAGMTADHPTSPPSTECALESHVRDTLLSGRSYRQVELLLPDKDGHGEAKPNGNHVHRCLLLATVRLSVADGSYVLVCLEDISERKQLEERLRQSQKLEGIGHLAGGIAHEFNNILAAIMLSLDFLKANPEEVSSPETMGNLFALTERAAELVRQLLAFSSRSMMQAKPLDLGRTVEALGQRLRRLLGDGITLELSASPGLPFVRADRGMIEQLLINLCLNARDAMPKGGRLELGLREVEVEAAHARAHADARAGRFVCLAVSDTGCGMGEATLRRLFEPFFTTKDVGKGVGLGLASAYGIARQHSGWIEVQSELGQGARFQVFLPGLPSEAESQAKTSPPPNALPGGHETVLLVEEDASVRRIVGVFLRRHGYQVLEAADAAQARALWGEHGLKIDLLLGDLNVVEGAAGLQWLAEVRKVKRVLPVIICSDKHVRLADPPQAEPNGLVFLSRPCAPEALARAVRNCLDSAAAQ